MTWKKMNNFCFRIDNEKKIDIREFHKGKPSQYITESPIRIVVLIHYLSDNKYSERILVKKLKGFMQELEIYYPELLL